MNAVNGDKMYSEGTVRCPAIYSSPEQLAIGLEARRYGGRTGLGESPCSGRSAMFVIVTSRIAV